MQDCHRTGSAERISGGWQITFKGRAVLDFMEAGPAAPDPLQVPSVEEAAGAIVAQRRFLRCH